MKVITVTVHRSLNYGAVLQAYGLHKKLNNMGYDSEVLDFCTKEEEKNRVSIFYKVNNYKILFLNFLSLMKYRESIKMVNNSKKFLNNYLKQTNRIYNYDELEINYPSADAYICGSDQIWNPNIWGIEPRFFLDFVSNNNMKKISYAASIGENKLDPKYHEEFIKRLNKFDNISVREENAKRELQSLTDKTISVVLDPVFLLNKQEWIEVSTEMPLNNKYILCYILYKPPFLNEFLKKLKNDTGYDVILVSTNPYCNVYCDKHIREVGPDGFLGLLNNAEIVVTTSFHGTAFSIIMEKQFFTFANFSRGTRISNIINELDLNSRLIDSSLLYDKNEIDYADVKSKLEVLKEGSISYIKESLENRKK